MRKKYCVILWAIFYSFCAANFALSYDNKNFSVFSRNYVFSVPQDPGCRNSNDASCSNTAVFSCKSGPIKINSKNNAYGDPIYYQLQRDYKIDLNKYVREFKRFEKKGKPFQHMEKTWVFNLMGPEQYLDAVRMTKEEEEKFKKSKDFKKIGKWKHFSWDFARLNRGILYLKKGYRWDGPSIELDKLRLAAKPNALLRASLVHDALYGFQRLGLVSKDNKKANTDGYNFRWMSDSILYMLSRMDGVTQETATINHNIIRLGGWAYTKKAMPDWKMHAVANAGKDQVVASNSSDGEYVHLDGSGSFFPKNAKSKQYLWQTGNIEAEGETPIIKLPVGIHTVTLIVDDGDDNATGPFRDSDQVIIEVQNVKATK